MEASHLKAKVEDLTAKGGRERKALQDALTEVENELDLAGHINRHLVEQRDEAIGKVREV